MLFLGSSSYIGVLNEPFTHTKDDFIIVNVPYTIETKRNRYTLKEVEGSESGIYSKENKKVRYVYKKDTVTEKTQHQKEVKLKKKFTDIEANLALMKKRKIESTQSNPHKDSELGKILYNLSGRAIFGTKDSK